MQEPPDELKAMFAAERAARAASDQRAKSAEARALDLYAQIAHLKHLIAKMRHDTFGASSEHEAKLDQFELQLADLVEAATEGKVAAEIAAPVAVVLEQKLARRPLPPTCRASASSMQRTPPAPAVRPVA